MSSKPQTPAVNVNEVSRISTGTVIKGEINSPNDIRIDGAFEGKLVCKGRVVVGENAVTKGDIICDSLDFGGRLEPSLHVKDILSLKDTCEVAGDLHVKRLAVELGARFNGACRMLTEGEFDKLAGIAPKKEPAAAEARKD